MEWNSEYAQLQLTCVTGTVQSRLNYPVYLQDNYLLQRLYEHVIIVHTLLCPSMVL